MPRFGQLAPRYVKGPSTLPPDLQGPTGKEYRTKGGKTATEMVATYTTPRGQAINAPLLVPGQVGVKRLLKGKSPTPGQSVRAIKAAKKAGAPRYSSVSDAEAAEHKRHKRLEENY